MDGVQGYYLRKLRPFSGPLPGAALTCTLSAPGCVKHAYQHPWHLRKAANYIKQLRKQWLKVEIIVRGDGGLCRPHVLLVQ